MAELEFKTLRQEVTDAIRMKILNGEFRPGERLVEQDIAADLHVSRGPVREALRQIEQEGLIEYVRNVGCSVKQIADEDIYEIYLLRATYEILAVKLCNGRASEGCMDKMRAALESMSRVAEDGFDASISYDNQFHGAIIHQIGLPRLTQLWESLNSGNVVSYYVGSTDRAAALKRQYPIHLELFNAYLTGETRAISKAIMDHYMLTTRRRLTEKGAAIEEFNFLMDLEL